MKEGAILWVFFARMPGSEMCLRLKQTMKTNNESIQSATIESSLVTPRQPKGACRKGTFY